MEPNEHISDDLITVAISDESNNIQPNIVSMVNMVNMVSTVTRLRYPKQYNLGFPVYTILIEAYRLLSCLLIFVVPQNCGEQVCSIHDLLKWNKPMVYNVALIFNFISLTVVIFVYVIEIVREKMLTKYLLQPTDTEDVELAISLLSLSKKRKILTINRYYSIITSTSIIIYLMNIGLSAFVVNQRYLNYQTNTTFITNALFMITKLRRNYIMSTTKGYTYYSVYSNY